jgi:hypothetical protein
MKINELKALKEQLQIGFYKRLINGKIKEAKDSLKFIFAAFRELNKIIPEIIKKLEEDSANQLNTLWQTFKNLFYEFQALAEKELDLTEQTFNEDPEIWKELLSSTFKKKIDELSSLIDGMNRLLGAPVSTEEPLPMFEYSPKYARQKEKDTLYSQYENVINKVELSIRRHIARSIGAGKRVIPIKGISIVIQTGDWKGGYHAYLPKPMNDHRIVYSWNASVNAISKSVLPLFFKSIE